MTAGEIRWDPDKDAFVIGDERVVEVSRDDAIVAALAAISKATVSSFERALNDFEEQDAATVVAVCLADVPLDEFDPDISDGCRSFGGSYAGVGMTPRA